MVSQFFLHLIAGAVLEKSLKTIRSQLSPPEHTFKMDLHWNLMHWHYQQKEALNELTAKQLRAWADVRNHAAHGNFDEFTKDQVGSMLSGINNFLIQYLYKWKMANNNLAWISKRLDATGKNS